LVGGESVESDCLSDHILNLFKKICGKGLDQGLSKVRISNHNTISDFTLGGKEIWFSLNI